MAKKQKSELTVRVLVALGLIAFCLPFLLISDLTRNILLLALGSSMIFEWHLLLGGKKILASITTACFIAIIIFFPIISPYFSLFLLIATLVLPYVIFFRQHLFLRIVGLIVISLAIHQISSLMPNLKQIFYVLTIVIASDIFAYFGGKALKGPKLAPKISPNKTISGGICALLASLVITLLLEKANLIAAPLNLTFTWILPLYLSCASILGDLIESAVKRKLKVKDSGKMLLAHGGVLDRFDGLIGAMFGLFLLIIAL